MSQPVGRDVGRDIGPGSLLWRYAGDRRMAFTGLSAGILQLLDPAIGAGVAQHSNFFEDPWDRIIRSIPQIMGVIYDPAPEAIGHRVRDVHRSIRGVDHQGHGYSALEPETFWWAHATFQNAVEQVADRFDWRRLDPGDREDLYRDGIEWYRRYGVSMRPVPPGYREFQLKWQAHLEHDLQLTPAASRAIDMTLHSRTRDLPFLPPWTRPLQPLVATPILRLTAIGGLPTAVRARFSIPWRMQDELEYRTFQVGIRELWRRLPARRRYGPVATRGYRARLRAESDRLQAA